MLDSNHNNFIFFDDGTENKFGHEIDFRANFEMKLRENGTQSKIPMILIVVQGGLGTLDTIQTSMNSTIPILILAVNTLNNLLFSFGKI